MISKFYRAVDLVRGRIKFRRAAVEGRLFVAPAVRFMLGRNAKVVVGKNVSIGRYCGISVFGSIGRPSELAIGGGTILQPRVKINCSESVRIGRDCLISWDVDIMDTDFHAIVETNGVVSTIAAPVTIEDRVWLGVGVKILKGVTIGHDSVVAAGAVVTRSFPPNSLIGGCPAKLIRNIAGWKP